MVKVVDKRKKWDRIIKQNQELKKGPVIGVGYPENKTDNAVIQYAATNHFGTHSAGKNHNVTIPPRPFIAVAIDTNKSKILNLMDKLGNKILAGQIDSKTALGLVGGVVVGMIQQTISGSFFKTNVPNAPSTIRAKKSSQPLIDHGIMREVTTWEVYPNGKPND